MENPSAEEIALNVIDIVKNDSDFAAIIALDAPNQYKAKVILEKLQRWSKGRQLNPEDKYTPPDWAPKTETYTDLARRVYD